LQIVGDTAVLMRTAAATTSISSGLHTRSLADDATSVRRRSS
jgi:hypothetical protein